jgi:branched-chain amino acid transport system ATP-binding protein
VNYGGIAALRDVTVTVGRGQIVAVLGANGAGKSTLLNAISGLVRIGGGRITYNGGDITQRRPHHISRMGIAHVPEGRRIVAPLTVEENLIVSAETRRVAGSVHERLAEVYDLFPKLATLRRRAGGFLSGGEQQMLAIGRALMTDPQCLLLDEPSLGLAPVVVDEVYNLLTGTAPVLAGRAVVIVEQSATLALSVAEYAYVLSMGSVVIEGSATSVMKEANLVEAYLGSLA